MCVDVFQDIIGNDWLTERIVFDAFEASMQTQCAIAKHETQYERAQKVVGIELQVHGIWKSPKGQ